MGGTMVANCTANDRQFGPAVYNDCRDGFDFTLLFEQSMLTLLPAGLALAGFSSRLIYLARTKTQARWGSLGVLKLV